MLRLVAYDISDSRRLAKVARICLDYGKRVGYSVFESDLDEPMFQRFWEKLENVIDQEKDRVIAYRICASCSERVTILGTVIRLQKPDAYIF